MAKPIISKIASPITALSAGRLLFFITNQSSQRDYEITCPEYDERQKEEEEKRGQDQFLKEIARKVNRICKTNVSPEELKEFLYNPETTVDMMLDYFRGLYAQRPRRSQEPNLSNTKSQFKVTVVPGKR